jgi:thiamine biosynthesis lipoprotein
MATPTRRQFLFMTAGLGGAAGLGLWSLLRDSTRSVTRTARALGSEVSITAVHDRPEAAIEKAFAELDRVEDILSLYRPHSELCRLNATGRVDRPHPYLVHVLRRARAMSEQSQGGFDVTVQPLWTLYAEAKRTNALPDASAIDAARAKVDWRKLSVSDDRITLERGMAVTLNGIAQGFALDRVTDVLRANGIHHSMINTGELGALGRKKDGSPWTVGIQHPRETEAFIELARLDGRCMATSGDYNTTFTPDRAYNHIFDPRTGRSPEHFSSVTIVAKTGMDADALSTAVFVVGLEKGARLIEGTPGADAFFVMKDGRTLSTKGFPHAAL